MTDKTIIDCFRNEKGMAIYDKRIIKKLEDLFLEQLTLAEKRAANDICKLIDKIELSYHGSSLEEWKAWKHIRNAIRDKYDPKGFQG